MVLNCSIGEDSWESLGLQGFPTTPSEGNSDLNIHWKDWCWSWNSNTLGIWCKELTHWKRPWCWQRLKAGGEREDRGWDGWMASPTWWTWVWVNSRSSDGQWSLVCCSPWGSRRVRHDWATDLNWTEFTELTNSWIPYLFNGLLLSLIILVPKCPWFASGSSFKLAPLSLHKCTLTGF